MTGYVFEAHDHKLNRTVALKRTMKAGKGVSREFEILETLKGKENIVQLLDLFYSKNEQDDLVQNTVMELCEGSLEVLLRVEGAPLAL